MIPSISESIGDRTGSERGAEGRFLTANRFPRLPFILLSALLLLFSGCSRQPLGVNTQQLLPALSFSASHIMIDNQNDYVWKQVTIRINEQYVYKTDLWPMGPSSLLFSDFRDAGGTPLDPERTTPHRLSIEVVQGFNGQSGRFDW